MSSVMKTFRRKKCDVFQITASVTSLSLEYQTKDWVPWRLAIGWDKTNPKHSSTKPVRWQGESNHGLHLWKEPDPVQNKFTLFKNSGKEFFQYKSTPWEILIQHVSPSGKCKVIAVGSLDLSEYIEEELASHVTVTLKPVKKSVLSGSLQFIFSSVMLKDGFPCQSDKEILDNFMKDTMELRRQSLQKASKSQEDSSKSSSQEASGSKATLADTVPVLQCDAATKASGHLEAAYCSTNNTSGKRKIKRKPVRLHPSRPAPPPPLRGVSQSTPPAARPPRPPPPSESKGDVKDVKHSLKHNEEKASKDGSSSRSAHPHKGRSGLKAKQKYPKELNPFGSDTPLPSSGKTPKCEFPRELNPFSEEYNDDQGSSTEGGTSEMATSPSNGISSDGTHFILVESSPFGKQAPMREDKHTPNTTMPEASTSSEDTYIHMKPVDSSPSGKEVEVQQEEHAPNTSKAEASSSSGDTSIPVNPLDSSHSGKEAAVQQEEHAPNASKPGASSSNGHTFIHVKPVESSSSGKEAAVQQEEHAPNTSKAEASSSSGDTSIHVKPVDSSSSGKEAAVQQEEHAPNTSKPEASTSSGDTSIPVNPLDSSPSGKGAAVQQEKRTPNTTKPEISTSSEDTSIDVKLVDSSLVGKEAAVQQEEHAPNTTKPEALHEFVESSDKEEPFHQEESAPTNVTPELSSSREILCNSLVSMKASLSERETPLQEENSTCSEAYSIPVVEASASGLKTPVHKERQARNTADHVASTPSKSPQELNPFSEGFNDEHGSSSEADTISSDVKQCDDAHVKTTLLQEERGEVQDVKGEKCNTADRVASTACKPTSPAVVRSNTPEEGVFVQGNHHENEAASLIVLHCPELFSSIDEEVCVLQEEIASLEKVSINLELEMQAAMQKKDCEEELQGLSQDWIGVANYRTELIRRKQDLETLATEKNLEACINRLRQELKYSLELEGWRKSEKNKVRDRLLLNGLVSFVTRRDFVSRMD